MLIRYGYDIELECMAPTPCIFMLDVRPEERPHAVILDEIAARWLSDDSSINVSEVYVDQFGNVCRRALVPAGMTAISASGLFRASGAPDAQGLGGLVAETGITADRNDRFSSGQQILRDGQAVELRVVSVRGQAGWLVDGQRNLRLRA